MKYLLLLLGLLMANIGFAGIPKPMKNTYVNDFAQVLTSAQTKDLNAKIHRIERLSSVQMAIVLVNQLPAEYDIEDYALLIGRKWHIGKNKNGLVYVAAIQQRKQRIEVARNLVNKLTDSKCAEILNVIKPYFRQKDYNGGLDAMVDAVGDELVPSQPVHAQPVHEKQVVKPAGKDDTIAGIIAAIIMIGIPVLVIVVIVRLFRRRNTVVVQQPPMYNNYDNGSYSPGRGFGGGTNINNYGGYYRDGGYDSTGSRLGTFAAGAAAGYAARTIQDHLSDDRQQQEHHHDSYEDRVEPDYDDRNDDSYDVNSSDRDSSNWGDWSSDDASSSSDNDSSSNSGFDGDSGSTSDW